MQGLLRSAASNRGGLDGVEGVEVLAGRARRAAADGQPPQDRCVVADTFDFGFMVDWMRKDLGICLQTADEIGAGLPVTALGDQFYMMYS